METQTEELLEKHAIKDTPFVIIKLQNKWFVTFGKYRLTEPVDTREEAEALAKESSWERIMQVIQAMIEHNGKEQRTLMGKDVAELLNKHDLKPKQN